MDAPSTQTPAGYTLYRRRWMVLASLTFLNLANNALWISYSSVADKTTEYFEESVTADEVDFLGTISFLVGIPMCLVSTYVVNTFGLRTGMYSGTVLTLLGGAVRALSTLPGLNQHIHLKNQYYMSLVGQALTGMGNPFAVSLPTKVSQNWFGEKERGLATGLLAMSLPLGIVLGQGCSPLFVKEGKDVPLMNLVWFGPALVTQILVIFAVTSSSPPTPPSNSARLAIETDRRTTFKEYLVIMKSMFTNKSFMVLFLVIGGAVGFFNAFSTQLSQLMCSRGYSNVSAGIAGSLLLGTGFLGAIVSGLFVEKRGFIEEVAKVFFCIAVIFGILIGQFLRKPDSEVWILLFCAMFGIFGFGMYPLGLELSVEVTYPVDESIGTALIFLSGQIQGAVLVLLASLLEQDLAVAEAAVAVCTGSINPKDHTWFLMLLSGFLTVSAVVFVLFFHAQFKRRDADQTEGAVGQGEETRQEMVHAQGEETRQEMVHVQGEETRQEMVHAQGEETIHEVVHVQGEEAIQEGVHAQGDENRQKEVRVQVEENVQQVVYVPGKDAQQGVNVQAEDVQQGVEEVDKQKGLHLQGEENTQEEEAHMQEEEYKQKEASVQRKED